MAGDPTAVSSMMNPYSSQLDPYFNQLRDQAESHIKQQFTTPGGGSYGGARQGVAEGQAQADISNQQAQMRYGEFNNAMNRAGQLANLGLSADQNLFNSGDYFRNIQQQYLTGQQNAWDAAQNAPAQRLAMLTGGMMGGAGAGSSTTQQTQSSPFAGLMGALMLGGSMLL